MDTPHVLIVDDDQRLCRLLSKFLKENDLNVTGVFNTAEAQKALSYFQFDLIVLDVMMPGETGLEFLGWLRKQEKFKSLPVLMLTAMGETEHRIHGLSEGADDYQAKPFDPRELILRIKSLLKRSQKKQKELKIGDFVFDMEKKRLFSAQGDFLELTAAEKKLLLFFINHQQTLVSREILASHFTPEISLRSVDVQVARLRKKIEPHLKQPRHFQTVRGKGYMFVP